jgi:competence protein ComEA
VVDVVGKVRRPGVYRLALGSRVDDVLRAAGGALPGVGLNSLNLARKVSDGEQIAVGVPAAPGAGPAPTGPGGPIGGSTGPIDLNAASPEQLDGLPGVGPVLAQRIVDWRTAHGRFDSIDQLREVSGIGPSKFDDIRSLVTV